MVLDISGLILTLQAFQSQFGAEEKDLHFLNRVLTSKELQALLRIHNKVSAIVGKSPLLHNGDETGSGYSAELFIPTVSNVFGISCEVIEVLQSYIQRSGSRDARDLILLLQRPAVQVFCAFLFFFMLQVLSIIDSLSILQSLFSVHDKISQKDYVPKLPELPYEVDEDEETVKIVQLVKSREPLV